jgi:transposase
MGTQSPLAALTETRGGTAPAGHRLYVGIDVGRRQHLVAAIPEERMENGSWVRSPARRVATTGAGFRDLTDWLAASGFDRDHIDVGLEPTGGWYAQTVAAWLERHGYEVSWLQNWALHERRQLAIGKQTKTDVLDARLIARLLYERAHFGLRAGFLNRPPHSADALRMLIRNRARLVEQHTRYRLQLTAIEDVLFPELKDFFKTSITGPAVRRLLEAYPTPDHVAAAHAADLHQVLVKQGRARAMADRLMQFQLAASDSAGLVENIDPILQAQDWLLYQLRLVDGQIDHIEDAIQTALQAWPAKDRAVLESFPGMSVRRQAVLLSTIGDISTFRDDRQLRKLLGWYPELRQSGTSVSKHQLGRSGNRMARRELWLWAMQLLIPHHQHTSFRAYYARLRDRGMPGQVAIGHLAGKLITVIFFCLRNGQPYNPVRHARALGLTDAFHGDGPTPSPNEAQHPQVAEPSGYGDV